MIIKYLIGGLLAVVLGQIHSFAQDTLRLTVSQMEQIFLEKNFALLVKKSQIEAMQAQEIQAKLWQNPEVSIEQGIYNPQNKRFFPLRTTYNDGTQGQNIFTFSQLILLAGKRNKRWQMAQLERRITEHEFYDLLRTLKYTLRSTIYELHYKQRIISVYDEQIKSLSITINSLQEQYQKGNIAWKEVVRLKALLVILQNERKDLVLQMLEQQTTLSTLLSEKENIFYVPQIQEDILDKYNTDTLNVAQLINFAQEQRQDLKKAQTERLLSEQNIRYQKALAIPDLKVQAVYDRNGSYIPNYWGAGIAIELPLFNRNQGNILSAKHQLKMQEYAEKTQQNEITNQVLHAYHKVREIQAVYNAFDKNFFQEFDKLFGNVQESYQKKNITLLEFLDYYESYKHNFIHINQLKNQRIQAFEELNFMVGAAIFK